MKDALKRLGRDYITYEEFNYYKSLLGQKELKQEIFSKTTPDSYNVIAQCNNKIIATQLFNRYKFYKSKDFTGTFPTAILLKPHKFDYINFRSEYLKYIDIPSKKLIDLCFERYKS